MEELVHSKQEDKDDALNGSRGYKESNGRGSQDIETEDVVVL